MANENRKEILRKRILKQIVFAWFTLTLHFRMFTDFQLKFMILLENSIRFQLDSRNFSMQISLYNYNHVIDFSLEQDPQNNNILFVSASDDELSCR